MLAVTLDDGGLLVRQQALEILRQAANASPAQKLERYRRALDVDPTCAAAHNNLAWLLVAGPESLRDAPAAVTQARRAVQFDGNRATYWNTLGVALYRDSQYSEAIDALKQALDRGGDSAAGYDLVFLALCHSRLGNETLAGDYYVRAETWLQQHHSRLSPLWQEELSSFFAEAKAVGLPRQAPAK
jgi:Tfp pilus assembly protein PilF